jgi:hypothetical protein
VINIYITEVSSITISNNYQKDIKIKLILQREVTVNDNYRAGWRSGIFFLILDCEAIGTAATPGLLCQPRVMVKKIVKKQMECRLAGETEVLGENLPQRHLCPSQNPT